MLSGVCDISEAKLFYSMAGTIHCGCHVCRSRASREHGKLHADNNHSNVIMTIQSIQL